MSTLITILDTLGSHMCRIALSEKGYMNTVLGIEFIKFFDEATRMLQLRDLGFSNLMAMGLISTCHFFSMLWTMTSLSLAIHPTAHTSSRALMLLSSVHSSMHMHCMPLGFMRQHTMQWTRLSFWPYWQRLWMMPWLKQISYWPGEGLVCAQLIHLSSLLTCLHLAKSLPLKRPSQFHPHLPFMVLLQHLSKCTLTQHHQLFLHCWPPLP